MTMSMFQEDNSFEIKNKPAVMNKTYNFSFGNVKAQTDEISQVHPKLSQSQSNAFL
jgi:hypothetical protein